MKQLGKFDYAVKDEASYRRALEQVTEKARKTVEAGEQLIHQMLLFAPSGQVLVANFDELLEKASAAYPDFGMAREASFRAMAAVATNAKAVGYIDVAEAWHIRALVPSVEAAQENTRKLLEKYGSIEQVPTRDEILYVHGRFWERRVFTHWTINRGPGGVWLGAAVETMSAGESRASVLDFAIDRSLGVA